MTKRFENTVAARFDSLWIENLETGCWEWTAAKSKGYGTLKVKGKVVKAYRFSFERNHGPIPDGSHILHSCNNKSCVNPAHLRIGTHADNMHDRVYDHPFGEQAHNARLTQQEVDEIRRLVASGVLQRVVASKFGTTQSNVSDICLGKSWPKVDAPC